MHLDLTALPPKDRYKLLTAIVIPRPIAWVTTLGISGVVNAAPFSFFNVFGQDPAIVILGLENRADGSQKDTAVNIAQTGEFVVNIVTPDLVEKMVGTAAAYGADVSEPDAVGLTTAPSQLVAPPRLADVPVAIECRKTMGITLSPEREILIGEAVGLHARDGLIQPDTLRVDWQDAMPVARLYADKYAELVEIAGHTIPKVP